MKVNGLMKWVAIFACTLLLASCASSKHSKMHKGGDSSASSSGLGDGETFWGDELATASEAQLLDRKIYYFDYDSSAINDNYKRALKAHANYLKSNPSAKMRVEGHTDERGSAEYNIALGERRAQTVAGYMKAQGAPADQIVIVSYGREKPAVQGHDESAWKFNRRAVLVYEAQ
jgi:peptidoglycan-associated lipoprotein